MCSVDHAIWIQIPASRTSVSNAVSRGKTGRVVLGNTLFALALLIVILPLVIWLSGFSINARGVAADSACVESWNQDQSALALGQHLFTSHGYRSALMVRGGSGGQDEPCLLVISALEPDPEYDIAAFLYRQRSWYQAVAGAGQPTQTELIDRQSEARAHPNLALSPSGTLVPY